MSNYGNAAIEAVEICQQSQLPDPVAAWNAAARACLRTVEGQKKGCPKSAFLGLCEEGIVKGVPRGKYTRSQLNKEYALRALRLLRSEPALADNARSLWEKVMEGETKKPNGQMQVVVALWRSGLMTA